MSHRATFAALALSLTGMAQAVQFGNYVGTPNVQSGNGIRVANSTLILPDAPNPVAGNLALWTGVGMSNGDLVQAIAVSAPNQNNEESCGNLGSNWCICASVLLSGAGSQSQGNCAIAYPGDHILMSYLHNDATSAMDQFVYINGALVSTYSSSAGAQGEYWNTSEECEAGTPCGVVQQHQWIDTVIVLDQSDNSWYSEDVNNAQGSLSSSDSVTWTAGTLTIGQFDFESGQ